MIQCQNNRPIVYINSENQLCCYGTKLNFDNNKYNNYNGHNKFNIISGINFSSIGVDLTVNVSDICIAENSVLVLCNKGRIYSMGDNYFGELGLGHNNNSPTLQQVNLPLAAIKMQTYYSQTTVLLTNNEMYSWGFFVDSYGGSDEHLFYQYRIEFNTPRKITFSCSQNNIIDFDVYFGAYLTDCSEIYCYTFATLKMEQIPQRDERLLTTSNAEFYKISGSSEILSAITHDNILYTVKKRCNDMTIVACLSNVSIYLCAISDELLIAVDHDNNLYIVGLKHGFICESWTHGIIVNIYCKYNGIVVVNDKNQVYAFNVFPRLNNRDLIYTGFKIVDEINLSKISLSNSNRQSHKTKSARK